jgi:hypothetical protein
MLSGLSSRIPIVSLERLQTEKLDYVVILPWNIQNEILNQDSMAISATLLAQWGRKFVVAVPALKIID